ncbi:hypothetical protein HUW63_23105, partial [Myxococcus sp. AM001]|nr:hypothetical protein [Myxococcus sp. AM001]
MSDVKRHKSVARTGSLRGSRFGRVRGPLGGCAHERGPDGRETDAVRQQGPALAVLAPGVQVVGYTVERRLGSGGFGAVYLARC